MVFHQLEGMSRCIAKKINREPKVQAFFEALAKFLGLPLALHLESSLRNVACWKPPRRRPNIECFPCRCCYKAHVPYRCAGLLMMPSTA
jgi:hypothetical protein